MKDWKKEIYTIPNLLSLFRLILIPVYVTIYLKADCASDYALSASILALSCLTDLIDGRIARKYNMISTLGKILDPIADKATQFFLLLCLAVEYPVLWSLTSLFIIKESFQLIALVIAYSKGKMLKGALFSGKLCTTVLFISLIVMVLFHNSIGQNFVNLITCIDSFFMAVAFTDYAITYWKKPSMMEDIQHNT